jgi:hypothetical protein
MSPLVLSTVFSALTDIALICWVTESTLSYMGFVLICRVTVLVSSLELKSFNSFDLRDSVVSPFVTDNAASTYQLICKVAYKQCDHDCGRISQNTKCRGCLIYWLYYLHTHECFGKLNHQYFHTLIFQHVCTEYLFFLYPQG